MDSAYENVSSRICGQQKRDQLAYPRSLFRAFLVRLQKHWTIENVSTESKCPDETLRMHWMILNLCILSEDTFSLVAFYIKCIEVKV